MGAILDKQGKGEEALLRSAERPMLFLSPGYCSHGQEVGHAQKNWCGGLFKYVQEEDKLKGPLTC